jgi:hypothetical protein
MVHEKERWFSGAVICIVTLAVTMGGCEAEIGVAPYRVGKPC